MKSNESLVNVDVEERAMFCNKEVKEEDELDRQETNSVRQMLFNGPCKSCNSWVREGSASIKMPFQIVALLMRRV